MKKFNFPLQFLLKYREKKEKRLKRELAEMVKRWEEEKKLLGELKREEMECQVELKKKRECGKVEIAYVLLYQSYLEELAQKIEKEKIKLKELYLLPPRKKRLWRNLREKDGWNSSIMWKRRNKT